MLVLFNACGRSPSAHRRTRSGVASIYLGDRVVVLGGSPASIMATVEIDLPRPRNQLTTREDARFLAHRHRLFSLLATQTNVSRMIATPRGTK